MSCFYSVGSAVENDDFGDFAAFRTGSPTEKHLSDDAFFTAFQSNTVLQVKYIESSHFLRPFESVQLGKIDLFLSFPFD